MKDGNVVRQHLNLFFDAVDKLKDMEIEIHDDLLSIMMLYSLSPEFENFRVAIESRDKLPTPYELRIKIIEEADARGNEFRSPNEEAFYGKRQEKRNFNRPRHNKSNNSNQSR
ncbi:unnamed protein product, partial [Nesidiocoris tenuis]